MCQLRKILFLGLALLAFCFGQTPTNFTGVWQGTVDYEGEVFEVVLTLEQADTLQGSIDIPAQGVSARPLLNLNVREDGVTFEVAAGASGEGAATFEGVFSNNKLAGMFTQNAQTSPLLFNRRPAQKVQGELTEARILELGQSFTEQLYGGEYERLAERFTEDMREAMDAQALAQLWQQLKGQIGGEVQLLEESASFQLDLGLYQRTALFGDGSKAIVQWVINNDEVIEGFTIRPDRS